MWHGGTCRSVVSGAVPVAAVFCVSAEVMEATAASLSTSKLTRSDGCHMFVPGCAQIPQRLQD